MNKLVTTLFVLFSITACTVFTSGLTRDTQIQADKGYVYGRFFLNTYRTQGTHLRMGVVLTEENNARSYTVQFKLDGTPTVIAVTPGKYHLSHFVYAYYTYSSAGKREIQSKQLSKSFEVKPGKAFYIADMMAQSGHAQDIIGHFWQLTNLRDNFDKTTEEIHTSYPNLKSLPTTRTLKIVEIRADRE